MTTASWTRRRWLRAAAAGSAAWMGCAASPRRLFGGQPGAADFGRRLEPPGRRVLHGAGQSDDAFRDYSKALAPNRQPILYMTYFGLRHASAGGAERYVDRLRGQLDAYTENHLVPQIGLSMTTDGKPDQHYEDRVAAGDYDAEIKGFCEGLRRLRRPAYVRIGYEFNGGWNGYGPETYRAAWRRIVAAFRDHRLDDVAAVWCLEPGGKANYADFYPGDDHVDWWSIDLFSDAHFEHPTTVRFMSDARQRRFPVMIGESTPRRVGILEGAASWDRWFAPYFQFIRRHEHVKAFCYISWNWSKYPKWKDWGDARIGSNAEVLARWRQELDSGLYLHGGGAQAVRRSLGRPE
jgi:hypothetical protein